MSINRTLPFRAGRVLNSRGFTLAEVLAALLFLAILIPVTMHGVTVASRAGTMGQRKAAAARIAERLLDEQIVTGLVGVGTPYGTFVEGDTSYAWSMKLDPWSGDTTSGMNVVSMRVEFQVQGNTYDIEVSTLYDPASTATTSSSASATTASTQ
jgi:type II secretory pathway pseudopilin PulG